MATAPLPTFAKLAANRPNRIHCGGKDPTIGAGKVRSELGLTAFAMF